MTVNKTCMVCNKTHAIEIDQDAFVRWMQGELIQNVAPELSDDDRELLISGVCGPCFDEVFGEDEEDDEE